MRSAGSRFLNAIAYDFPLGDSRSRVDRKSAWSNAQNGHGCELSTGEPPIPQQKVFFFEQEVLKVLTLNHRCQYANTDLSVLLERV